MSDTKQDDDVFGWFAATWFLGALVLVLVSSAICSINENGERRIDAIETRISESPTPTLQDQISALQTQVASK